PLLIADAAVGIPVRVEIRSYLVIGEVGSPVRPALQWALPRPRHARLAEVRVIGVERGSQGAAGVARGGLNPDVLERALAQQPPVRDAVEGNAAGQAQHLFPLGYL